MPHRTLVSIAVIVISTALTFTPAAWSQSGASSTTPRIVAIGDIHGAADAFVDILEAAGLIDDQRRWSGGNAVLVQTGDYLDRGAGVRQVLDLLIRLEEEARRGGGRVEVLLGNHEAMNILRDFRDVSPEAFATFATAGADQGDSPSRPAGFKEYVEALGPEGRYGRWLRSRKPIVKIDQTVFLHAGVNPELRGGLDEINRMVQRELRDWDAATEMMVRSRLIDRTASLQETIAAAIAELERVSAALKAGGSPGDSVTPEYIERLQWVGKITKSSLVDTEGPLWFRGFALWPDDAEPQMRALLERFDAERFVSAHTPMLPGRITPRFGNRLFLIDTGMLSSYYTGGRASALELVNGRVTAIYIDGREVLAESWGRGDD